MGHRWKEVQSDEEIDNLQVRLPQIGGMAPERYIPTGLIVVAVLLLLALLVLPGVRKYGTVLTVTSAPMGASVYIDDQRVGATPVETFVPAGKHTVNATFPGFEEHSEEHGISGRLIGSLFFPRRKTVEIHFTPENVSADWSKPVTEPFSELMQEYHQWALAGPPGGQFQHPPTARTLGRILWANTDMPEDDRREMYEGVAQSLVSAASASQAPDILSGLLRSALPGAALHAGQLEEIVQLFIQTDSDYQAFYEVIGDIVAGTPAEGLLRNSSWYEMRRESLSTELLANSIEMDERGLPDYRVLTVDNILFAVVSEGSFISGYPLRSDEETGVIREFERVFYIGSTEITDRQYARFLRENEMWRPSNRNELADRGLADGGYLEHWPDDGEWTLLPSAADEAEKPVRNISWFAADAYVDWLNSRFQAAGGTFDGVPREDLEIRLPDSTSWEYAAFLNGLGAGDRVFNSGSVAGAASGRAGAIGAFHLSGNLWEWTSDWYTRHIRVLPSEYGAQRAVIGGSFANDPIPPGITGGQPPEWTTPFLGFRPAMYRVLEK